MTEEKPEPAAPTKSLAVIRIRGPVRVKGVVEDTMKRLNLFTRNMCVIVPKTPSILGMVMKVKDYVTYGEIDDETLKLLKEKRGKKEKKDLKEKKEEKGLKEENDKKEAMPSEPSKPSKPTEPSRPPKPPKPSKPSFTLHPPRGGFERKGIKKSFNIGGALGYRGQKINDLIKRMV